MDEKTNKIKVYSYNKVWKTQNELHAIQNIVLPVPVALKDLAYFILIAGIMFILSSLLPLILKLPFLIRYAVIPYAVTQFLLKKKLDGKAPHKFLLGYVKYILTKNEYVERLKLRPEKKCEKIKLSWICSTRNI